MKVLITGAAGGIGSAAAAAFERAGHSVLRHDLRADPSTDIAGDLLDPAVLASVAELTKKEDVGAIVAAHGVPGSGELHTMSAEAIMRIMSANTSSVIGLYEELAHQLQPGSVFVAVSSQAGLVGEAGNAVYCASKFALIGWARGLAATLEAPRMRVLCPGMTETPLLVAGLEGMAEAQGRSYDDFLQLRLSAVPLGRLGRASEIGRAAVWLSELQTPACVVAAITGGATFE